MADRCIAVDSDDPSFFSDFFTMFGGTEPSVVPLSRPADMQVSIRAHVHPRFGLFRMSGECNLPVDSHEFRFAIENQSGNFQLFASVGSGWTCIGFRDAQAPMFSFQGADCIFALDQPWRLGIVWYLFWRLLRMRSDAIFFHASALGIFGQGTIFVGQSGAGKSTTSLALAARGHNFLSDEVAGYLPETGELISFRRPVGIRPGPKSAAVERGLGSKLAERIARDGFVRVHVGSVLAVSEPRSVPLHRIVFLRGFAEKPLLERIKPGRDELVELQPLMSSFLNASHGRRVFELTRLLSCAKVYRLQLGDPDVTAKYLEEAFACE
jgi:hypothetical protein